MPPPCRTPRRAGPGLAWYAGGDWLYQIQDTARLTAQQGGRYRGFALVTGVRFSF